MNPGSKRLPHTISIESLEGKKKKILGREVAQDEQHSGCRVLH